MEEYNRSSTAEDDPSDDDEDDEEGSSTKRSKPTRVPRAIINNMSAEKQAEKKDAVPSLVDRLFQKKEEKPDEKPGKEELEEELEPQEESKTAEFQEPKAEDGAAEVSVTESGEEDAAEEAEVTEEAESEPWDEGEIIDDGEINLSRTIARMEAEKPAEEIEPENTPGPESNTEEPVESAEEEPEPEAGGSDGGEVPPHGPEDTADDSEEPEPVRASHSTGSGGGGYFGSTAGRFTRESDTRAAEDAMNEAIYRATKMGQNRGVVAGLLGGLYLGHRGKKKLEGKFEKTIESKNSEIKQLQNNQAAFQERLGAALGTKERISAARAEKAVQTPLKSPEAGAESASLESSAPFVRIESVPGAPLSSRLEALSAVPLVIGAETLRRRFSGRERVRYAVDQRGNIDIRRSPGDGQQSDKELPPEELPISEEFYITPDGRRIEMSSWHRIEVDAKTGKVVNNPEVEYGEEFRREIRQEVLRDQRSKGGVGAAMQLGNMASASAQSSQAASQNMPVPVNPSVPLSPAAEPMQSIVKYGDDDDGPGDPLVWIIVTAFVVILFLFAILR